MLRYGKQIYRRKVCLAMSCWLSWLNKSCFRIRPCSMLTLSVAGMPMNSPAGSSRNSSASFPLSFRQLWRQPRPQPRPQPRLPDTPAWSRRARAGVLRASASALASPSASAAAVAAALASAARPRPQSRSAGANTRSSLTSCSGQRAPASSPERLPEAHMACRIPVIVAPEMQ